MSLKNFASANDVAAFANSEGCNVKLPIAYQQRCPAMVFPNANKPTSDNSEIIKIIRLVSEEKLRKLYWRISRRTYHPQQVR